MATMTKTYRTCTECGARLADGAIQCTLCGWPVDAPESPLEAPAVELQAAEPENQGVTAGEEVVTEPEAPAAPLQDVTASVDRPATPTGVYCNQCGWKNPPGARFCSMCGASLQILDAPVPSGGAPEASTEESGAVDAPAASPAVPGAVPAPPSPGPSKGGQAAPERKAVTRQVGIIVGAGVLLVVALFLVTAVSKMQPARTPDQPTPPGAASAALPAETPLPAQLDEQVAAIEDDMAQLDGAMRIARQRDLIPLFFGAGRLDRAALEQEKIAQATGTLDDWKRAGDLFYDWMNTFQDGQSKAQVAGRAIEAYQTVLAQDPDNHDVRTDMATAFLSTGNPMQGVTEVKRVLEAEPNHLHARFNYGLMLTWINRPDQAIEQFEWVKSLVEETSDYYQRAEEAIRIIRQGDGGA